MIKIVNWSKYQSYKDRRPPWIRFHRTMLDDYEYQSMSADSRALLPMLWLLACEDKDPKSGLIQLEIKAISFRLRQPEKVINKCLDELQVADFIECIESVTKPLLERNETVPPETETETEKRQNIPYQLIVDEYHGIIPEMPRLNILTDKRKRMVKKLFNLKDDHKSISWWKDYFNFVRGSDFLMDRIENPNSSWKCDFEFLVNVDSFVKIIDRKYHK